MSRPKLLDLFAGAGGAGVGYARAGFDVTAVDIEAHPDSPHPVIVADAVEVLADSDFLRGFDAIHASPPCQAHTTMSNRHRGGGGKADSHVELIPAVRQGLEKWGGTYVIENVPGAATHLRSPVRLRGGMFGLGVDRPRLFEVNRPMPKPPRNVRVENPIGVYGNAPDGRRLFTRKDGSVQRAASSVAQAGEAMGIDWMNWDDLREAIPPIYTWWVGRALLPLVGGCALILHATTGTCPGCHESVLAPGWNQTSAPGCYWCGQLEPIACRSACGCVPEVAA